jgi:hypothetical protein
VAEQRLPDGTWEVSCSALPCAGLRAGVRPRPTGPTRLACHRAAERAGWRQVASGCPLVFRWYCPACLAAWARAPEEPPRG